MEKLIGAVGVIGATQGPRLRALFGCMYYGMLRHSDAASLLLDECSLPGEEWGVLEFSEITSATGRDWTDHGQVHEASTPKGGPRNAVRKSAGPARAGHDDPRAQEHGTAPDGRLFRTYKGRIYQPSTLWRVLQKARKQVFTPAQLASPLARRPYDCRHAGVSWRLNAGVPAPLVAEWAGHTVEVLLRIYAHCIEGDDDRWFGPMDDALGRG
jgi:integrase